MMASGLQGRFERALLFATAVTGLVSMAIIFLRHKRLSWGRGTHVAHPNDTPTRSTSGHSSPASEELISPLVTAILTEVVERLLAERLSGTCSCQARGSGDGMGEGDRPVAVRFCNCAAAEGPGRAGLPVLENASAAQASDQPPAGEPFTRAAGNESAVDLVAPKEATSESSCDSFQTAVCTPVVTSQEFCPFGHELDPPCGSMNHETEQLPRGPSHVLFAYDSPRSSSTHGSTDLDAAYLTPMNIARHQEAAIHKVELELGSSQKRTYKCLTSCRRCSSWRACLECPCYYRGLLSDYRILMGEGKAGLGMEPHRQHTVSDNMQKFPSLDWNTESPTDQVSPPLWTSPDRRVPHHLSRITSDSADKSKNYSDFSAIKLKVKTRKDTHHRSSDEKLNSETHQQTFQRYSSNSPKVKPHVHHETSVFSNSCPKADREQLQRTRHFCPISSQCVYRSPERIRRKSMSQIPSKDKKFISPQVVCHASVCLGQIHHEHNHTARKDRKYVGPQTKCAANVCVGQIYHENKETKETRNNDLKENELGGEKAFGPHKNYPWKVNCVNRGPRPHLECHTSESEPFQKEHGVGEHLNRDFSAGIVLSHSSTSEGSEDSELCSLLQETIPSNSPSRVFSFYKYNCIPKCVCNISSGSRRTPRVSRRGKIVKIQERKEHSVFVASRRRCLIPRKRSREDRSRLYSQASTQFPSPVMFAHLRKSASDSNDDACKKSSTSHSSVSLKRCAGVSAFNTCSKVNVASGTDVQNTTAKNFQSETTLPNSIQSVQSTHVPYSVPSENSVHIPNSDKSEASLTLPKRAPSNASVQTKPSSWYTSKKQNTFEDQQREAHGLNSDASIVSRTRTLGKYAMRYLEHIEQRLFPQTKPPSPENKLSLCVPTTIADVDTQSEEHTEESEVPGQIEHVTEGSKVPDQTPEAEGGAVQATVEIPKPIPQSSVNKNIRIKRKRNRASLAKSQMASSMYHRGCHSAQSSQSPPVTDQDRTKNFDREVSPMVARACGGMEYVQTGLNVQQTFDELEKVVDNLLVLLDSETAGDSFSVSSQAQPSARGALKETMPVLQRSEVEPEVKRQWVKHEEDEITLKERESKSTISVIEGNLCNSHSDVKLLDVVPLLCGDPHSSLDISKQIGAEEHADDYIDDLYFALGISKYSEIEEQFDLEVGTEQLITDFDSHSSRDLETSKYPNIVAHGLEEAEHSSYSKTVTHDLQDVDSSKNPQIKARLATSDVSPLSRKNDLYLSQRLDIINHLDAEVAGAESGSPLQSSDDPYSTLDYEATKNPDLTTTRLDSGDIPEQTMKPLVPTREHSEEADTKLQSKRNNNK